MTAPTVDVAFACPSELGEGAIWDEREQLLYWVDIVLNKVYAYNPANRSNLAYDVGESVGTVVLTEAGQLLLGLRSGIAWLDRHTGKLTRLVDPEPGKPHTRLNDGKCDPQGRFWVGSICEREPQFDGGLYCLDHDLSLKQRLSGIQCSNGLVWSKKEDRFYYIDTPTQEIWGFSYDAQTGNLRDKCVVATIPQQLGCPDGMTIDEQDHLWVALWDGGKVIRVDPQTGHVELEIPVPARNVTSVAFGGRELNQLYITTARAGLSPEARADQPLAGSLFHLTLPCRGVVAKRFGGRVS